MDEHAEDHPAHPHEQGVLRRQRRNGGRPHARRHAPGPGLCLPAQCGHVDVHRHDHPDGRRRGNDRLRRTHRHQRHDGPHRCAQGFAAEQSVRRCLRLHPCRRHLDAAGQTPGLRWRQRNLQLRRRRGGPARRRRARGGLGCHHRRPPPGSRLHVQKDRYGVGAGVPDDGGHTGGKQVLRHLRRPHRRLCDPRVAPGQRPRARARAGLLLRPYGRSLRIVQGQRLRGIEADRAADGRNHS